MKMSDKGQLVVPKEIREDENFEPSDKFIAISIRDGVIFKKIEIDLEKEYDDLKKRVRKRFEEEEVSEDEVDEVKTTSVSSLEQSSADKAVEWGREFAEEKGITRKDVEEAIEEYRK